MDKGVLAPPCLIQIEAVLFDLAVKGYQTLVVHARLAALIPGIGGKVEHVPHMGGPHATVPPEEFQHEFVIQALVFLGMVIAFGLIAVEVGHGLGAVFRVAQRPVGVEQMEHLAPQIVQKQPRHIPAQIEIPRYHVGDMRHLIKRPAHGVAGQRGKSGLVQRMAEVIQHTVVVQHILFVFGADGNFIGNSPADDRGMVVILDDQLFHLGDGVFSAVG